jgi:hypothetical protein
MKYYQFTENLDNKTVTYYVPMSKEHRDMIASLIESNDEFDSPYAISEEPGDADTVYFYKRLMKTVGFETHVCNQLTPMFIERLEEGLINITENDPFYKGYCWNVS